MCLNPATRSVTFKDGRTLYVDHIIFCTGYQYDFSFIKKTTNAGDRLLFEAGLRVSQVDEHMFYTGDPSLAFVGLPKKSAAFTVAEAQSAYIARMFAGRLRLWRK